MDIRPKSRRRLIVWGCLAAAAAGIVAVTVLGVPLRSLFLYAMIAACPLMHLFMGHGAHGHDGGEAASSSGRSASPTLDKP
jgi:hypothetical protein